MRLNLHAWPLHRLDLNDIRIITKPGGTVDDSEMVDGIVFDQKAAKTAGGPGRMEKARIALIQFCISPPKSDIENNVVVSDYTQVRLRRERAKDAARGVVQAVFDI